jgi:TonB-dependent starch-binding outer membrane protein SusC
MKLRTLLLVCSCIMLLTTAVFAQGFKVTGKILSKSTSEPLEGATVTVKGTSTAVMADKNGIFSINVPKPGSVLVVTFSGMVTEELVVNQPGEVSITLADSAGILNEVVVIGYGQQKKALVTGAISSVKADQLQTVSNTRIEQAMQGRVAGVQIVSTSAQPGAGVNVRIRGTGSNRNSSPLFIIDGIKAGGMESLDPADIASIDVLKDAASSAIYGSEGANGVVIITTKTGKKNTSEITYQAQFGVQSVKDDLVKMMNAQQYQQYLQEAGVAGAPTMADVANIGEGTNWMNEVLQTAPQQHHTLTLSGGSEKSTYLVSGTIFTQEGVVGGDKSRFRRYTARFNGEHKVKPWLNFGNRILYSHHRRQAISDDTEFGSILASALVMDPTTPITYQQGSTLPAHVQAAIASGYPLRVDPNGNLYGISNYLKGEYGNPLARIDMAKGENVQNKIIANVFADIEPLRGFKFTSRFGIDAAFQVGHGWTPTFWFSSESQNTIANAYDYSNNWFTWIWENFATYQKKIGQHNFTLMAGTSAEKSHEQHMGGSYSGLFKEEDKFSYADFVPDALDRIGSIAFNITRASFYGRVTYDYKNKYLLNASLRSDGSSKFAEGYRWKTYPAISVGWVLSNENFYAPGISQKMNYAKLRFSWGQNGTERSANMGEWMNAIGGGIIYPDATGVFQVGASPTSLAYPQLTWETGEQIDFGADLAFFNGAVTLTVDYYKKKTKDLLTTGTAPLIAGNYLRTVNAGNVENKGFEVELGYRNRPSVKGLGFELFLNFSTLDNKITYLDPNSPILYGAGIGTGWSASAMQAGYPIWYYNGYKTDGIFQTQSEIDAYIAKHSITGYSPKPGEPIVVDVNGDKQISPADMTYIGSPHPDYLFGGRAAFNYKGFDLLVFAQGQVGNEVIMGFNRTDRSTANKPLFFYANRWTGPGSTNEWFAANTSNPYIYNSDLMVFDGSFVRIRQLQLGYSLPPRVLNRIKVKNARVYISLDDYFTFTKYPGVNPEVGGGNGIGIDRGTYPLPRKAIAGLTFTF